MNTKDYIYYGLFLDENEKIRVKDYIRHIDGYNQLFENCKKEYLDNCTLLHCSQEDKYPKIKDELIELEKNLEKYGKDRYSAVMMKVTHIGYLADKVMAIKVNPFDFPCANDTPHITICTFGDGKPVDSNKITDWDELTEPFVIYGAFGKVKPNNN